MATEKAQILLLDDELEILNALKRLLRKDFVVHIYTEGSEALAALAELDIALIVSDMRMPGMDGAEFLAKAKGLKPEAVRILLTGYADMESTIRAVNDGHIYGYLSKPWDNENLLQQLNNALKQYYLEQQVLQLQQDVIEFNARLQQANETLEQRVEQRTSQLKKSNLKLQHSIKRQKTMLQGVLDIVGVINQKQLGNEPQHIKRIATHAQLLTAKVAVDKQLSNHVYLAALVKDIGKLSLPSSILSVQECLMDGTQKNQYLAHTTEGAKLIGNVQQMQKAATIIGHYFEDYNGKGYPKRLAGKDIPLGARVLRVVCDYDSLLTGKKEKTNYTADQAADYLNKFADVYYDPLIVKAYLSLLKVLPTDQSNEFDYCVASKDLEAGMILSQSVNFQSGSVMLTEGTELTDNMIAKISQYETEHNLHLTIFVS